MEMPPRMTNLPRNGSSRRPRGAILRGALRDLAVPARPASEDKISADLQPRLLEIQDSYDQALKALMPGAQVSHGPERALTSGRAEPDEPTKS